MSLRRSQDPSVFVSKSDRREQNKKVVSDMTTTPKCKRCGAPLVKMLNVDKKERGGGRFMWICENIDCAWVKDAFDYTHLEIYCAQPQQKEAIAIEQ